MKFSAFLKRGVGRIGSQRLYRALWVFYAEFRFLPSPLTKSSAPMAPTHLKCLLFLQVPSQCPDYSLLQARNPVSQLGLGLKGRRHQMSVLCSAPWWTYPVVRNHPPHISRLGLSVAEYLPLYILRALGDSRQCLVNIKCCRERSHGHPKSQHETPCAWLWLMQCHLVFHDSRTGKNKATHFLRFQQHRLINSSSAHPGQPSSMLPSINLLWPIAGRQPWAAILDPLQKLTWACVLLEVIR